MYKYINIKHNSIETMQFCARSYIIRNTFDNKTIKKHVLSRKNTQYICLQSENRNLCDLSQYTVLSVWFCSNCTKIHKNIRLIFSRECCGRISRAHGRTVPLKQFREILGLVVTKNSCRACVCQARLRIINQADKYQRLRFLMCVLRTQGNTIAFLHNLHQYSSLA